MELIIIFGIDQKSQLPKKILSEKNISFELIFHSSIFDIREFPKGLIPF